MPSQRREEGVGETGPHKVQIYPDHHSPVTSSELGLPHPLSRKRVCPTGTKGERGTQNTPTHSPACEGVEEFQFGRLEKKLSTLSTMCRTLWSTVNSDRLGLNTEWWKYLFASEKHCCQSIHSFGANHPSINMQLNILKRSQFLSKLKCTGKCTKHEFDKPAQIW